MLIDSDRILSITEANQNFSKVARMVDENGSVIILKNNRPRYLIVDFNISESIQFATNESVDIISERLMQQNLKAYKELAK